VRSGIAFPYRMKQMIRSLGLKRLHQVVERPDTAQVRGLVARIPHLVQVVQEAPKSIWAGVPEYTIRPPEAKPEPKPARAAATPLETAAAGQASTPAEAQAAAPARKHKVEERAAVKPSSTKKAAKAAGAEKAAKTVESKKKEKREKQAKPAGKGKK
jgi:large subunit ribosomal protein L30